MIMQMSTNHSSAGGDGGGGGGAVSDQKAPAASARPVRPKKRKSEVEDLVGKLERLAGTDRDAELEWHEGHKHAYELPGHTKCGVCGDTTVRVLHDCQERKCPPLDPKLNAGRKLLTPNVCSKGHIYWPGGSEDLKESKTKAQIKRYVDCAHGDNFLRAYYGAQLGWLQQRMLLQGWEQFERKVKRYKRFYDKHLPIARRLGAVNGGRDPFSGRGSDDD